MRDQLLSGMVLPGEPDVYGSTYIVRLEAGVLWVVWTRNLTVSDDDAVSLTARVSELCPDVGAPMLVELNEMVSLSRNALRTFATDLNVTALALVGSTIVDETLADFFIRVHEPPYPTRYFTTVEQARDWLIEQPPAASD